MAVSSHRLYQFFHVVVLLSGYPLTISPMAHDSTSSSPNMGQDFMNYLQCQICQTPTLVGKVVESKDDVCHCNYETVDTALEHHFNPLLRELSTLTFFRYFKINLHTPCPYWTDDENEGVCAFRECSVCDCPDSELPALWHAQDLKKKKAAAEAAAQGQQDAVGPPCAAQAGDSPLSRVATASEAEHPIWNDGPNPNGWSSSQSASREEDKVYVNLLDNPEAFTGYSGHMATRIWQAIYHENCILPQVGQERSLDGLCLEERVSYRLLSGLHASINTHIAMTYQDVGVTSLPYINTPLYVERVGKHPARLENLYFTYLFVMRAVGRITDTLLTYDFATGDPVEEARVRAILKALTQGHGQGVPSTPPRPQTPSPRHSSTTHANPTPLLQPAVVFSAFKEHALFKAETRVGQTMEALEATQASKTALMHEFKTMFQNISRLMDCVSCEKCRLWGTLQVMGLGTAIEIILAENTIDIPPLGRNELVALLVVLTRLSESVESIKTFRNLEFAAALQSLSFLALGLCLLIMGGIWLGRKWLHPRSTRRDKHVRMRHKED